MDDEGITYCADRMVVDVTIGLPAFELHAAETVLAVVTVPPKDVVAAALDSLIETSNDGICIEGQL